MIPPEPTAESVLLQMIQLVPNQHNLARCEEPDNQQNFQAHQKNMHSNPELGPKYTNLTAAQKFLTWIDKPYTIQNPH